MRINTNMAALNAWRTMTNNSGNLQKSLERLASGYRLNRAADDAAGLAVSEKMTAQIRGLGMATRNTQDAISMVQTAEGGAAKVQEMMQRMRELAVQAGSDSLDNDDRAKLQEEFALLQAEITRTTETVTFNGRRLIDGSAGDNATVTTGTGISGARVTGTVKAAGTFEVDITQKAAEETYKAVALDSDGGAITWTTTDTLEDLFAGATDPGFAAGDKMTFAQDGKSITIDLDATKTMKVGEFIAHVNNEAEKAGMKMQLKFDVTDGIHIESNIEGTYGDVSFSEEITNGGSFGFIADTNSQDAVVVITDQTVNTTLTAGVDYTVKGNQIIGVDGKALQGVEFTVADDTVDNNILTLAKSSLTFQVGANQSETITTAFGNLSAANLGIDSLSISDRTSADTAIDALDTALSTVSTERAKMGATQNRLENTISILQTQSENLTAANSRIRDLDMASEMAQFTKFQILSQASTAMLAQANQITQGVLSLLR